MMSIRGHAPTLGFLTVALQIATVVTGVVRVCWGGEHTHAGVSAPACAMHHHTTGGTPHAHDDHGSSANDRSDGQITCACRNESGMPWVAVPAILPPVTLTVASIDAARVDRPRETALQATFLSPPAPPPRSIFPAAF